MFKSYEEFLNTENATESMEKSFNYCFWRQNQ